MALRDEVAVAVGAVIKEDALKGAKGALAPGHYEIDALVRIHGEFNKGNDSEMRAVAKIDHELRDALAYNKLNIASQDAVDAEYERIAALAGDERKAEKERVLATLKERTNAMLARLKATAPMVPVNGRVTTTLLAELVADPKVTFKPKQ